MWLTAEYSEHKIDVCALSLRRQDLDGCAHAEASTMRFNVAGLLMDSEGAERQYDFGSEVLAADGHRFTGVSGTVRLLRTDRTVLATAVATATSQDSCSRCLKPVSITIETTLEEEFRPENRDLMMGRPAPGKDDRDPALMIDERNILDLSALLTQTLSMASPMAPVCRPNCKGLCKTCFVKLNEQECQCDENPIDVRWQKLAKLAID